MGQSNHKSLHKRQKSRFNLQGTVTSRTSLPAVYVVERSLEVLEGEVDEEDSSSLEKVNYWKS